MWICIMGVDGSGKNVIADILDKRSFKKINHPISKVDSVEIYSEFNYLSKRLSEHLDAQSVMNRENIYTMRSVWDTHQVMYPSAQAAFKVDGFQETFINIFADNILNNENLQPPHCVIYTKMSLKDVQNRILLKGKQPNDEEILKQIDLYEKFMVKVRVPIIDVDMSQKPEDIRNEINFSIDSMQATAVSSQTIWKRKFFF